MSFKKKKKRPSSLAISNSSLGVSTMALARIGVCVAIGSGRSAFTTRRQVAGRGFPRNFPTPWGQRASLLRAVPGGGGGVAQRGICKPEAEWVGSCGRAWGDQGQQRSVDSKVRPARPAASPTECGVCARLPRSTFWALGARDLETPPEVQTGQRVQPKWKKNLRRSPESGLPP